MDGFDPNDPDVVAAVAELADVLTAQGLDNFDVGMKLDGGLWGFVNPLTEMLYVALTVGFGLHKMMVEVTGSVVRWALTLNAAVWFTDIINSIAGSLHTGLGFGTLAAGGESLVRFALVVATVVVLTRLIRGRNSQAGMEVAVTLLVLIFYFGWVASFNDPPPGGGDHPKYGGVAVSAVETAQGVGGEVAAMLMGSTSPVGPGAHCGAAPVDNTGCVIEATVRKAMIMPVYELVNWGRPLGEATNAHNDLAACAHARDYILSRANAPYGTADFPREKMAAAGTECEQFADYQAAPNWMKVVQLSTLGFVSVFMMIPALGLAMVAIWVALVLTVLAMASAAVFMVGLIPGAGRSMLWSWVASVAERIVTLATALMALALFWVLNNGVMAGTDAGRVISSVPLVGALLGLVLMILVGMMVLVGWYKLNKSAKASVRRLIQRLAGLEAGSVAPRDSQMRPARVLRASTRYWTAKDRAAKRYAGTVVANRKAGKGALVSRARALKPALRSFLTARA